VAAVAAGRPNLARLRRLATAAALLIAVGTGVAGVIVATAPGRATGATALSAGVHVHHIGDPETGMVYRAVPGGQGGRWVYQLPAPAPQQTTLGVTLAVAAAALFLYAAIGYLRRRSRAHADAGRGLAQSGAS
jgi:ABC-type Mn2+/Zn2+ transport system permease subunit